MPQKSVLTGNILKLPKIYEANRTGKIMVFFAAAQHTHNAIIQQTTARERGKS